MPLPTLIAILCKWRYLSSAALFCLTQPTQTKNGRFHPHHKTMKRGKRPFCKGDSGGVPAFGVFGGAAQEWEVSIAEAILGEFRPMVSMGGAGLVSVFQSQREGFSKHKIVSV